MGTTGNVNKDGSSCQLTLSGDFTHDWHRPLGHSGRARSNPKPGPFGVKLTYNVHTRVVEELHQVAATRTDRQLFVQMDFRREMRPIAFVDPGRLPLLIRSGLPGEDFRGFS